MKASPFLAVLEEKKSLVWPEIKRYLGLPVKFPSFCQVPTGYRRLLNFHREMVSEYPSRKGKYLRPSLVLLTAQAMGFPEERAIKTAAAMQVSEEWILDHDDIEDRSWERRGKPTLHRIYGNELAINAGDCLHVLMWKILRDNEDLIGRETTFKIMDEFYRMLNRTVFGQTVEIKWAQENRTDLKEKDILLIMESKTGYYTIAGPMRLGAILAGANETQLRQLYEFGKILGYCFQIKDDLLDLVSDFAGLKKQRGNDIYEGKRTVILVHLLNNIGVSNRRKLLTILQKPREEKSAEEVEWVIKMMVRCGSLRYSQVLIQQFLEQAKRYFSKNLDFLSHLPARRHFLSFFDFLSHREY